MSTTGTSTKSKKNKNSNNDERGDKRPLFEQIDAIVIKASQQPPQFKKRITQKKDQSLKQSANKEPSTSTSTVQKPTNNTAAVQEMPEDNNNTNGITHDSSKRQKLSSGDKHHDAGYYSGSSYDDDPRKTTNAKSAELEVGTQNSNGLRSNDLTKQDEEDTDNEEELNNVGEINDTVESSSEDTMSEVMNENIKKTKKGEYQSLLSPNLISSLQWWVRNPLFQQIKIIDESHLDTNGPIIQEALDKIQIDKSSKYFNACVNEIRKIIKRAMCSRRGYVKHEISEKLKSKLHSYLFLIDSVI
jgi:hypothetical protein